MKKFALSLLGVALSVSLFAQYRPLIKGGQLPIQAGKKLVFNPDMSDEFENQTSLDRTKWQTAYPGDAKVDTNNWIWKGRDYAIFQDRAVTVFDRGAGYDGELRIEASKRRYNEWTHEGGLVRSRFSARYGYYECKMKANKTMLSSTFWLNQVCWDKRITELDITETVGVITGTIKKDFPFGMNSNTHSVNGSCQREGNNVQVKDSRLIPTKEGATKRERASDAFHVYGVFWKNANELIFYLDGVEQYRIDPAVDFDRALHLFMVVEAYSWNQAALGRDNMRLPKLDRTTRYKYVRSWTLDDTNQLLSDGTYHISSVSNNQRLGLSRRNNVSMVDVASNDIASIGKKEQQKWLFLRVGNNEYTIQNLGTRRFLEVPGAKCENNANVSVINTSNGRHRRWKIVKVGTKFQLRPAHCSSRALDRHEGRTQRNTNVQIDQASNSNRDQRWIITRARAQSNNRSNARTTTQVVESELSSDIIEKSMLRPNPSTNGIFQIDLKGHSERVQILIVDVLGNVVYEGASQEKQVEINTRGFQKTGIYSVRITSAKKTENLRLIIR